MSQAPRALFKLPGFRIVFYDETWNELDGFLSYIDTLNDLCLMLEIWQDAHVSETPMRSREHRFYQSVAAIGLEVIHEQR